jgi:hypothetical protein
MSSTLHPIGLNEHGFAGYHEAAGKAILEKDSPVQSSQSLNRGSWNDCQSIRQKEILSGSSGKGNL